MTAQPITSLMSDAELDSWADIYAQAKIAELIQIPLSEFLQDPWAHLINSGQESALDCIENGYAPLLPAQARAGKAIRDRWASEDKIDSDAKRTHLTLVSSR
jgi:hypothetical protein